MIVARVTIDGFWLVTGEMIRNDSLAAAIKMRVLQLARLPHFISRAFYRAMSQLVALVCVIAPGRCARRHEILDFLRIIGQLAHAR